MFPDLGLYLVEQGQKEPFELAVFNHLMLGEDRVLGWLINGVTYQFRTSGLDERPAPIIPEPMMFSIYLGRGSKTRTSSIAERLRTEGLVVVARSVDDSPTITERGFLLQRHLTRDNRSSVISPSEVSPQAVTVRPTALMFFAAFLLVRVP